MRKQISSMRKKSLTNIVITTIHPWNIERARKWQPPKGYRIHFIKNYKDLSVTRLNKLKPRYIFFTHWSQIIPEEIFTKFECIVFHMTDLPFGRGGSPLQNLISRGIYKTKISALRVCEGIDAGPIYLKTDFDLSKGSALTLYKNANTKIFAMIRKILTLQPEPKKQKGKITLFKRRKPEQSKIPQVADTRKLYDFIRMLDAPGYPRAFLIEEGKRYEFYDARISKNGTLLAKVDVFKI